MEEVVNSESVHEKSKSEVLWDRIYRDELLEHEEICEKAFKIFEEGAVQIAPVRKLLCSKMLCSEEWLCDYLNKNSDLAQILEQITLRQELEIFRKWADGQLKESSAQELLRKIRDNESAQDLSEIFSGGEGDGEDA
jgi:hypothetical protein